MSTLREAVTILLGALDNWKLTGAVDAAKAEVRLALAQPPSPDYVRGQERMRERAAVIAEEPVASGLSSMRGAVIVAARIRSLPLEDAGATHPKCACTYEAGDSPCPMHGMDEAETRDCRSCDGLGWYAYPSEPPTQRQCGACFGTGRASTAPPSPAPEAKGTETNPKETTP